MDAVARGVVDGGVARKAPEVEAQVPQPLQAHGPVAAPVLW